MSEFCAKCAEKEAAIELIRTNHYQQIKDLEVIIERLKEYNDELMNEVAFYGGNLINLSCNNK